MRTIDVLRIRQSQLQFAYSGHAGKQLRMRDSPLTHRETQLLLDLFLSYYFFE
jgi:hypothetical protein